MAEYTSDKGKVYKKKTYATESDSYASPAQAKRITEANKKPWLIGSKENQNIEVNSLDKAMQDARDYKESRKIVDRINPEGGSSTPEESYKKGGVVKKSTHSAKRRDGCAQRGKTKGRFV